MTTLPGRARQAIDGLEHLVGGLATAVLALAALVWVAAVALACLIGVGLLAVPGALRVVRAVADRERARLSRWGPEMLPPEPVAGVREVFWLAAHATFGFAIGLFALAVPLYAVQDLTFPLWWR